ncbi:MAG: DMT family transporter [Acidobacteria bacterium]|nr:DMT family transporter [Acidobacteriota bacterium]
MKIRAATLGAACICLSAALWGLDGVVLTPRLANLQVPFVVFLLHAIPFALMQPFLWSSYRRLREMPTRGWLALSLVAFTGGLLGTLAIVNALFLVDFNQLSVVVLLQKLQPVFALALAAVLLGERVSARFVAAAVVALAGAYLLTFGLAMPDATADGVSLKAALLAILAAAAFGSATVLSKMLLGSLDFKDATFARYGMTSAMALLYLAVRGIGLPFASVTGTNWAVILVISLTTGSGAIFLYYYGLTRVRASVATICELCLPLSAVLLDYIVNDSVLGPWQWVGAALLVGAILRITITPENGKQE